MVDMSSDQAFRAIEKIAATSSKTEKETLVKSYLQFDTFRRVCVAAYDVRVTYGMEKVPERDTTGKYAPGATLFVQPVWDLLDNLAKRILTGNAAREEVHKWMQLLTPDSAELLKRIIKKDLRAGFTGGTVNRVAPGTLNEEPPYMRCALVKDVDFATWPWAEGVIVQEKHDGQFVFINHELNGDVLVLTRAGNVYPMTLLKELATAVRTTLEAGTQVHGELLVVDKDGAIYKREVSNGKLNSLMQGESLEAGDSLVVFVWDQIPLVNAVPKGKYAVTYRDRFKALVLQLKKQPERGPLRISPTKIVKSLDEAMAFYKARLAEKKEGAIAKHPLMPWQDGTSKFQVKLKLAVAVDLRAKEFVPGTGKNAATFGSIRFVSEDELLVVDVSGFKDAQRKAIADNRGDFLGQIGTVLANGVLESEGKPASLFLPRIVEFPRVDKTAADTLERVKAQFDSAIGA